MIYIIEDDENIRNLVQVALNGSGYETAAFETAEEALGAFKVKAPQLAIFDLMLPGMDGLEAIRKIRANDAWKKLPVLVLTAKDKEYDKVAGLDGGADDYMTKPFSVLELLARVRSLLRRTKEEEPEQPKLFDCGALHLDLETREVKVNGSEVLLTYKEYELLVYLAENQNRVVSRDELLDKLWDWRGGGAAGRGGAADAERLPARKRRKRRVHRDALLRRNSARCGRADARLCQGGEGRA